MCRARLLFATAALVLIAPPAQAQAQAQVEDGVDAGIDPGDDFFAYANGEWLRSTAIPPGKGRWGARNQIAATATLQRAQVLREASGAGTTGRRVAAFHAAYLDEASIEKKGLAPMAPLLKRIDRLRDKTALARWLGAHLRADVDPLGTGVTASSHLFGLAASFGIHGEPHYRPVLTQGGLGLPDREDYLDASPAKQALRDQRRARIAQLLQHAGASAAPARADAVLALETALARSHASAADSGDERNIDQRWQHAQFARQAPGLDWRAFFAAAGLSTQAEIIVWQPGAMQGGAALVASQPLAVWQDYLRVHTIERFADVLPRALRDAAPQAPRDELALAATQQALPEQVGRLYVERHFPPERKARVKAILDDVAAALAQRVGAARWMSPATRELALAKLKLVYFGVAYPETWTDDSALAFNAADAIGNLQRLDAWHYRRTLAKLGRPVDRREWGVAPQTPGAILNFQLNAYNFAAALLQPPKFDANASEAAGYGAIGAIFGHELSHSVDTLGAEYDAQGATHRWWTPADKAAYDAAAQPLIDQFAAYRPLPGVAIDGRAALTENVADLIGLTAAFDAYRLAVGRRAVDAAALRQMDRQFFIGFARSWRAKLNDDGLRTQFKDDAAHAPEPWRVATVRNLDAWYEAFDVKPGHRLYLAPAARVRVW